MFLEIFIKIWDRCYLINVTTPSGFDDNVIVGKYFPLQLPLGVFLIMLLPTGSEERGVLGVGSIPVAILPSCQNMKIIALQLHNMNIVGQ